jgi:DNA-binding XRE family transcriptional regulator/predicted RNase H-like HicB family nuclease
VRYPAIIVKEADSHLVEFPDCGGCQTFADPGDIIETHAREALEGWLESTLASGELPPKPSRRPRIPRGARSMWVDIPAKLAIKIELRWARKDAGLTQAQLAKRAGVSQPMIAQLEHPDYNPTIETLERVAGALGVHLDIALSRSPVGAHKMRSAS